MGDAGFESGFYVLLILLAVLFIPAIIAVTVETKRSKKSKQFDDDEGKFDYTEGDGG